MNTDPRNRFVVALSLAFLLTSTTAVTAGHVTPFLAWDAAFPAVNGIWASTTFNTDREWAFGGASPALAAVNDIDRPGISAAYEFDASTGLVAATTFEGIGDAGSASFEMWFKPASLVGNEQVLWETGGGTGTSLTLNDDLLRFGTAHDNTADMIVHDLTGTEIENFIQVVGVIDMDGNAIRMYVNGQPAGSVFSGTTDWSGGNPAGLGSSNQVTGGFTYSTYGKFVGQIAIMRFYQQALTDADVLTSFNEVAVPEPASGVLLLVGLGLALLPVVRRRRW